jgi:hypothetical protein
MRQQIVTRQNLLNLAPQTIMHGSLHRPST